MKNQDPIEAGLTDETRGKTIWILAAAGVVGLVGVLWTMPGLTIRDNLDEVISNIVLQYASLALAIERSAAVFVAMTRDRLRVDWVLRIDRLQQVLDQDQPRIRVLKQLHDREQNRIGQLKAKGLITELKAVREERIDGKEGLDKEECIEEYMGYLTAVKHVYEFQHARFQSVGRRYTAIGVFLAGIALAALGLSLFDSIFANIGQLSGMQGRILHYIDIVITGGLVGGGSTGINTIATRLTERNSKA